MAACDDAIGGRTNNGRTGDASSLSGQGARFSLLLLGLQCRRSGLIKISLRRGAGGDQSFQAADFASGSSKVNLGPLGRRRGSRGLQPERFRVKFGQNLTLIHVITHIDMEPHDTTAALCGDLMSRNGADRPDRHIISI